MYQEVDKGSTQCYKYRVNEYIAEGPKINYRIYRRKYRQTLAKYKIQKILKIQKCKKSQYIRKNREISP